MMKPLHSSDPDAPEEGTGREERFPVVWLGGEGRSLNVYMEVLRSLPQDTGMAFVLAPNQIQRHLRSEVLSVVSKIPVVEVEDGMRLETDCVFIASPGRRLSVEKGVFRLRKCLPPPEWPKTVNALLYSLAADLGDRVVAVVLSGLNGENISALQVVKDAGGVTFAQSDESAGGMSSPASKAGPIDHLLPPEDLVKALLVLAARQREG